MAVNAPCLGPPHAPPSHGQNFAFSCDPAPQQADPGRPPLRLPILAWTQKNFLNSLLLLVDKNRLLLVIDFRHNTMEDEDENFEEETGAPWDDLMNEDVPSMDPNDVSHTQLCCPPRISQ